MLSRHARQPHDTAPIYDRLVRQINGFGNELGVQVITVCAHDGRKGTISRVCARLLMIVDELLRASARWGTVVVDGTPSARTLYFREAHRALDLDQRRILEDEVLRDSAESHFIQMADICAHSAFQLRQHKHERYLYLKRVLVSADEQAVSEENPGFFYLAAEESADEEQA